MWISNEVPAIYSPGAAKLPGRRRQDRFLGEPVAEDNPYLSCSGWVREEACRLARRQCRGAKKPDESAAQELNAHLAKVDKIDEARKLLDRNGEAQSEAPELRATAPAPRRLSDLLQCQNFLDRDTKRMRERLSK